MRYSNEPFELVSEWIREHRRLAGLAAIVLLIFVLVVCWMAGRTHEPVGQRDSLILTGGAEDNANFSYLAVTELDRQTDPAYAKTIDLSTFTDTCEITEGGSFRLTGKLEGNLVIQAKEQNVHLFLDNVTITSRLGPAIHCQLADKLTITLLPDTENVISDSGKYHADAEIEACIYSECDTTFNGTGSLTVTGLYKDAIRSRDLIKILDGDYTIKCKRTGIHGNDGIRIDGGSFLISSEKNGLKTTKSGAYGRGNLMVLGGDFRIIAGRSAFVTTKAKLYIQDCTINQLSVVSAYNVAGGKFVQEGCVQ